MKVVVCFISDTVLSLVSFSVDDAPLRRMRCRGEEALETEVIDGVRFQVLYSAW